jgi:predicted dehydrogenase
MTGPIRIAIVGAGSIAQLAHLPVLERLKHTQLTALIDNDRAKARSLADRFGIPDVFTDIDEFLEYAPAQAAVVATPNHLHEPHLLGLIAAGFDVFCERPLSLTSRGVERILVAAARAKRKVVVANNYRFRNDVQTLNTFLRGGELGKMSAVRAGWYRMVSRHEGWRARRQEAGGGALMQLGFPLLDLAMWINDFPAPQRVWASMQRARGANAVEDAAVMCVECANGLSITVDVATAYVGTQERWWCETLSSRGSASLGPLRVTKMLAGEPVNVTPTGATARESAFVQSYRAELSHFVAMLRGEADYEPPTDQVIVHRILEAAYKSAEEGKEVRL